MGESLSRKAATAAVFAALYAVLVVALAPISFLPLQVRVADALLPLTMLYGGSAALGLALGAMVANFVAGQAFFGGWTPIDVVGGGLANLAAGYLAWRLAYGRGRAVRVAASLLQALLISLIVGSYLWVIFGLPSSYSIEPLGVVLPGLPAFWLLIGLGSMISIVVLGNLLLEALLKSGIHATKTN